MLFSIDSRATYAYSDVVTNFNSLDVNIAIRVTSLIVSYVFNYGYRCLLVAEDSPFLKNHMVSLL